MNLAGRTRVLIGHIGLDGHEMGGIVVSAALRDAGMEVVYLGLCQTAESIVKAAIEEDVDVVGISSMAGIHNEVIPEIMQLLNAKGGGDIIVIAGGIIPKEDIPALRKVGVKEIFGPGTTTARIVDFIRRAEQAIPD